MSFDEWKEVNISDTILSSNTGLDAIKRAPIVDYDSGIKCLRIQDISQVKEFDDWGYCAVEDRNFVKFQLKKGDIIVARTGATIGVNRLIKKDLQSVFNNGLIRIRVNPKLITSEYLYYNLQTNLYKGHILAISGGTSTQPNMKMNDLLYYSIKLPLISEQEAITTILVKLDDKIEVNNQINRTLENMAQTIFKQWFVDFEFPNEDGEPYKSSGGEMVESELGMIPKGWEVSRIGDECFCSLGGTPSRQKSDYWNGDIPWVNSGQVNNFRIYKPSEYITKLGLEKSATKLLKKKTTVLAITGATLGQVSLLEIDTCTNQSVVGISENDKISHVYIYPYVKSVIKKIIGNQTGGAQQHINKGNVEDTKLLIPNKKVLNAYTKLVRPQYDLISSICFENELLTRLRDSILPKLMSGKIRVPLDSEGDVS